METNIASIIALKNLIKSSDGSTMAIPKAIKYIKPHYDQLKLILDNLSQKESIEQLAFILSFLSIYFCTSESCYEALKYLVKSNLYQNADEWGFEYIKYG